MRTTTKPRTSPGGPPAYAVIGMLVAVLLLGTGAFPG